MSSYYHTRSSSVAPSHPHAAFCVQPSLNSGPIIRKCTLVMSSPRSFVADCHAEKSLSDICAAIRHHILDQVTCAADPLASAKQHVISDVRPYSTPPYNVRGTKWVISICSVRMSVLGMLTNLARLETQSFSRSWDTNCLNSENRESLKIAPVAPRFVVSDPISTGLS